MKNLYISLLLGMFSVLHGADDEKELVSRGQVLGYLSLTTQEPITKKSFGQIVKDDVKSGVLPIIARVEHNGAHTIYDAHEFNNLVFKDRSIGKIALNIDKYQDPVSKKPLKDIRYFILYAPSDKAFETIGSLAGMKSCSSRRMFVRALLRANDSGVPLQQRALTFESIGQMYARGKGPGKRDAQKALLWFNKAINQDKNQRARAKSFYSIAQMYREGQAGLKQNYAKAAEYYLKVIDQNDSVGSRQWGRFNLAKMFMEGGYDLDANLNMALKIFTELAKNATIPEIKKQAKEELHHYAELTQQAQRQTQEEYERRFGSGADGGDLMQKRKTSTMFYPEQQAKASDKPELEVPAYRLHGDDDPFGADQQSNNLPQSEFSPSRSY